MVHGKNRIPYWIDWRLPGLAGPEYDATISSRLASEPEDSQYGEYRLSGVTGDSDEIIAIENEMGQFYVEILPTDNYFKVGCEITHIDDWPTPDEYPTKLIRGIHLVGRDITAGTYSGTAGSDIGEWCTWRRLSGVTGDSDEIIAIENEMADFYVTIEPTDYAFKTGCELTLEQ